MDNERKVTSLDCNCDGGSEGSAGCKHWYAVLLFINNSVDESKTDEACEWIAPSKMGQKKYPKGQPLEVIANIPDKFKCPPVSFQRPSDEYMDEQAEIMEACGCTDGPIYKLYKLKLKGDSSKVIVPKPDLPQWVKKKVFIKSGFKEEWCCKPSNVNEQFYYDEHVKLTPDQAFRLCSETVDQAGNPKWHEEREKRITGSTVHNLYQNILF